MNNEDSQISHLIVKYQIKINFNEDIILDEFFLIIIIKIIIIYLNNCPF